MDMQFYPTPRKLARKAWDKFKNKNVVRLLEPSTGEGALLKPWLDDNSHHWGKSRAALVDCIEINISRHPILINQGLNVVGIDFLQFNGAAIYSHILLNPPFQEGTKHVLKAWDILFDGEIVAIVNAESIKNPFSGERKMLVNLIEQYGSVEFLQDEFMSDEADRKTPVEIALIHLEKKSNFEMDFLSGLEVDSMTASGLANGYQEFNEIAVHQGMIENVVTAFKAAVKAAREAVFAEARARYYTTILGDSMEVLQSKESNASKDAVKTNLDTVRKDMQERYDDLKNRAWTQVLRSTQVTSRLSSKAQKRLESEFESVKQLEFATANILGFILGLINKQSEINIEMLCDTFDAISMYHHDNRCYYKGWKSNSKHRTGAWKVKMSRFIIPRHRFNSWGPDWETTRFLADFDKVFSMLDGRKEPEISLEHVITAHYKELMQGERIDASYFSIRVYPGVGTIHFFPRDRKLIDRFNKLVGKHRAWLPNEGEKASDNFWLQYDKAEKFSSAIQTEIAKANRSRNFWNHLEYDINSNDESIRDRAVSALDEAIDTVLLKNGINPTTLIESDQGQAQLLLSAA